MKEHIEYHHEGIVYNCDQCDYKAVSRNKLMYHYQGRHEDVELPMKIEKSKVEHNCDDSNCKARFQAISKGKDGLHECTKCEFRSTLNYALRALEP